MTQSASESGGAVAAKNLARGDPAPFSNPQVFHESSFTSSLFFFNILYLYTKTRISFYHYLFGSRFHHHFSCSNQTCFSCCWSQIPSDSLLSRKKKKETSGCSESEHGWLQQFIRFSQGVLHPYLRPLAGTIIGDSGTCHRSTSESGPCLHQLQKRWSVGWGTPPYLPLSSQWQPGDDLIGRCCFVLEIFFFFYKLTTVFFWCLRSLILG